MNIEITHNNEIIDVELDYEISRENDSIGSYEYWGFQYYDHQSDRIIVDEFKWNKSQYTPEQNKAIELYIYNNFDKLEEQAIEDLKEY